MKPLNDLPSTEDATGALAAAPCSDILDAHLRQIDEAKRLGWTATFWNFQSSPDMGKWGGHRARLFGLPPGKSVPKLVPDFFGDVVAALDANYPNDQADRRLPTKGDNE